MSLIEKLNLQLEKQHFDFEIIKHEKPIKSKKNDASGYFNLDETAPTLIINTEKGF